MSEEDQERIITEYMPNGSLDDVLKQVRAGNPPKFWTPTNIAIIITGIACGMRYVHTH